MQAGRLGEAMHPLPPEQACRKRAVAVAQQFEQIFTRSLVATMRQSGQMAGEDGSMFGSGPGADTYADWFDQHLSEHLSQQGRVGIAEVILRDLERHGQIEPTRPATPAVSGPTARAPVRLGGIDVAA